MNCSWCGLALPATMEGVAIDHIIPRARGGPNDRWNKQLLHTWCNVEKGGKLTPAAEALARARGVVLREPAAPHRMAQPRKFTIDAASPVHDYRQLAGQLRERIEGGVITGELPPLTQLRDASGLSLSSVQRAVRVLKDEGLVYTVKGRGMFVRRDA